MINASLKKDQNITKPALLFGLFLFIANLIGFTAFRCSISGDLFGGDIYGFTRNTNSYLLKYNDILKPDDFFSSVLSGKNKNADSSPNAFIWSRLSDEGRQAAGRISSGNKSEWDKELFIIELNKSLVDVPIEWPKHFLVDTKDSRMRKPDISNREYNIRILAALFPQISAPTYLDKVSPRSLADRMWNYVPHLFTLKQPTRYAPLSALYTVTLHNYLQNSPGRILNAIVIQAVFYALLMALMFFLAME
ncbi:MAG: hypothetical protein KKF80_06445, partial [Candidatus Omnitrophica bacterium]|nr:hypothetical protein [Candidatus Omnitrophota bacterium]